MSKYRWFVLLDKETGEALGSVEAANEQHARNYAHQVGRYSDQVIADDTGVEADEEEIA